MLSFSDDGRNMPRSVIEEVGYFSLKSYHGLIPVLGDVQTTQKGGSMKVKTPISIHIKSNGCPEIPAVTKADGYRAKDLQAMLRDYCTTHIRESPLIILAMCDARLLGYVSGKKKATIPWAKLSQDPSSWIKPECVPDGFQWADPSKVRIRDLFLLLEHWRKRKQHRLKPLIWASSCPLLEDVEKPSEHRRDQQQHQHHHTDTESSEGSSDSKNGSDSSSDNSSDPTSDNSAGFSSDDNAGPNSDDSSLDRGEPEDFNFMPSSPHASTSHCEGSGMISPPLESMQ